MTKWLFIFGFLLAPSMRAADGDWKSYRFKIGDSLLEFELPYARLESITKSQWSVTYHTAPFYRTTDPNTDDIEFFSALINSPGPFWVGGVYGRIRFVGYLNRKPSNSSAHLSNVEELTAFKRKLLQNREEKWEIQSVEINGRRWMHWFRIESAEPKPPIPMVDRYTVSLTDDWYFDVVLDTYSSAKSEKKEWLKDLAAIHDRIVSSLKISDSVAMNRKEPNQSGRANAGAVTPRAKKSESK